MIGRPSRVLGHSARLQMLTIPFGLCDSDRVKCRYREEDRLMEPGRSI